MIEKLNLVTQKLSCL